MKRKEWKTNQSASTAVEPASSEQHDSALENPEQDEQFEAMIDQTLADSFPASDPPAWTLGREPEIRNFNKP